VKKMAENVLKFVLSIFVLQKNLMTLSAKKNSKNAKDGAIWSISRVLNILLGEADAFIFPLNSIHKPCRKNSLHM
jgi:hypothetical protein